MFFMRGIKNIRPATFAGNRIDVGTRGRHLYCYGLITFSACDGLWTLLEQVADDTYRACLPGGRKIESQLVYVNEM
jgi:hypothetical protein